MPALYTDMAKLEHVLDILRDIALESGGRDHVDILVQNAPVGLMISFHVERWHPNLVRNNPALQLAERTVVLMSGSFHFKEHGVMVLLPWPTLSGAHVDPGYGTMMFLRGDVGTPPPSWLDGFSQVQVVDSATLASSFTLPDNLTQIAYDASSPGDGDAFVLNLLPAVPVHRTPIIRRRPVDEPLRIGPLRRAWPWRGHTDAGLSARGPLASGCLRAQTVLRQLRGDDGRCARDSVAGHPRPLRCASGGRSQT